MPHTLFSLAPQVPPERALPDPPLLRLEAEASQAYLSVLLHVQAAASEPVKAACSLEARLTQLCLRNLERFEQQELEAGESGDEDGETPPPQPHHTQASLPCTCTQCPGSPAPALPLALHEACNAAGQNNHRIIPRLPRLVCRARRRCGGVALGGAAPRGERCAGAAGGRHAARAAALLARGLPLAPEGLLPAAHGAHLLRVCAARGAGGRGGSGLAVGVGGRSASPWFVAEGMPAGGCVCLEGVLCRTQQLVSCAPPWLLALPSSQRALSELFAKRIGPMLGSS